MKKENRIIYREVPQHGELPQQNSTHSDLNKLHEDLENSKGTLKERYERVSQRLNEVRNKLADLGSLSDTEIQARFRQLGIISDVLDSLSQEAAKEKDSKLLNQIFDDLDYIYTIKNEINIQRISIFSETDFKLPDRLRGSLSKYLLPTQEWAENMNKLSYEDQMYVLDSKIQILKGVTIEKADIEDGEVSKAINELALAATGVYENLLLMYKGELERAGQPIDFVGILSVFRKEHEPKLKQLITDSLAKIFLNTKPDMPKEIANDLGGLYAESLIRDISEAEKKELREEFEEKIKKYKEAGHEKESEKA
jgi:hypothetical protein